MTAPHLAGWLTQARTAAGRGDWREAEAFGRRILRVDDRHGAALHVTGIAKLQQGEFEAAAQLLEQATVADPENAELHCQLAAAYRGLNRLPEAMRSLEAAIRLAPESAALHFNLGLLYAADNNPSSAEGRFRKAVELQPAFPEGHNNLGRVLAQQGEFERAARAYREAIRHDPDHVAARFNLGNALMELGRTDEAVASYRRALKAAPNVAAIHNNLGQALTARGQFEEAARCFAEASRLDPNDPETHNNLGTMHQWRGELDTAADAFRRAIELRPEFVGASINLGNTHAERGNHPQALACFDRALHFAPGSREARFNRALALIAAGDFRRGWQEYESRFGHKVEARDLPFPEWDGKPLGDAALLITAEQGLGDELMFATCFPDVLARCLTCFVECDSRLLRLFARAFPQINFLERPADAVLQLNHLGPEIAAHISAGSLPKFFRRSEEAFPQAERYLTADQAAVDVWKARLQELGPERNVGVSWRGGSENLVKRLRSTCLDQWKEVLSVPGCRFIDLQYGETAAERRQLTETCGLTLHRFAETDPLRDLDGFAALLSALDLLISVDNSTVHLAGALGVETWCLLPSAGDFRWLHGRSETLWYRSVRLIRQQRPRDWAGVFRRVAAELAETSARSPNLGPGSR